MLTSSTLYCTIFLALLTDAVKSNIYFAGTSTQNINTTYYSTQVITNHIACLKIIDNITYVWTQYVDLPPKQQKINLSALYTKLRTTVLNSVYKSSQFILFTKNMVYVFSKQFTANRIIYKTPSNAILILDAVFGQTYTEFFILTYEFISTRAQYFISYYKDKTLKVKEKVNISSTIRFNKMLYKNTTIYMNFVNIITVYSYNSKTNVLKSVFYKNYQTFNWNLNYSYIDMDIQPIVGNILLYKSSTSVYLVNSVTFASISSFNLTTILSLNSNTTILSCKFINQTYLAINTNSFIYQFDYVTNHLIHKYSYNTSKQQQLAYSVGLQSVVAYSRIAGTYTDFYQFNSVYLCFTNLNRIVCSNCVTNYTVNRQGNCQKTNLTNFINSNTVIQQINISLVTNQSNIYFQLNNTYIVESSNSTAANTATTNTTTISNYTQSYEVDKFQYCYIFQSETAGMVAETLGKTLVISSFRIFPKSLMVLKYFVDELQYYIYHNTTYPTIMQSFLLQINLTDQLNFMPDLFNSIGIIQEYIGQDHIFNLQNDKYYMYSGFSGKNPKNVYFLHSSAETYKLKLLTNVLVFSILKLIHGFLYLFRKSCNLIKKIYIFFKQQTKWWTFIVALLQTDLIKLTFQCFLQFNVTSSFNFFNKLNFTIMIILLYCLIYYGLTFYLLISKYYPKESKIVLTRSKSKFDTFIFEPYYLLMRNLMRGFIHGFFLTNYQLQIILLFAIDLPFIGLAIKMRRIFLNKFTFFFSLLYSTAFTILDLYFVLQQFTKLFDRQMFAFVLILILMSIFAYQQHQAYQFLKLLDLVNLYSKLQKIIKFCLKKNKRHINKQRKNNLQYILRTEDQQGFIKQKVMLKILNNRIIAQ